MELKINNTIDNIDKSLIKNIAQPVTASWKWFQIDKSNTSEDHKMVITENG